MIRWVGSSVVAMGLLLVGAAQTRAEFIVNGGFETGNFTGWAVTGGSGTHVNNDGNNPYSPHGGSNNYAALGPPQTNPGSLSQTFADANSETLTLSFFLASNGLSPNGFSVSFNGTTLLSLTDVTSSGAGPPFPYTQFTFSVASQASNTLTFAFYDDPSFLALDDVSVTPAVTGVPEPASLTLLGLGLVGLLGYGRIRRLAKR